MKPYKEIIHCKPQKFLRMTGITQKNFSDLYDKITTVRRKSVGS
ncbi:MAG: hypothetical protein Q9N67_02800 [Ghiorsea sp.]|nr:hypothetical protein [Ghiorsea sp.]